MNMGNRKIQCVSFPRSGHHLLARCLKQYFSGDLHYCSNVFRKVHFKDAKTNYQKNHDFDLCLPNTGHWYYVIQYRHPIESVISWYKWEVDNAVNAEKNTKWRALINRRLPFWNLYTRRDTQQRWLEFIKLRIPFWQKFVQKWVIQNQNPNTCFVPYNELVADSCGVIRRVILFANPSRLVNHEAIREIVARNDIGIKHEALDFRYYDAKLFRDIEESVLDELKALNLKRLF